MTDWKSNLPHDIFDQFGDLHTPSLFMALCNRIPNNEQYSPLNVEGVKSRLKEEITEMKVGELERLIYTKKNRGPRIKGTLIVLSKDLLVNLHTHDGPFDDITGSGQILWTETTDEKLLYRVRQILKDSILADVSEERFIHLVSNFHGELDTTRFKVDIKPADLSTYFNDSLLPADQVIQNGLTQRGGKALILLHGEPGTGKTTYIRHLVASVDKSFIYVPPSMTNHIADPAFITMLSQHQDSVLVVEDADNALMTRNGQNNSAVSNLLNLTDGLLADCFNLKVICTINTHVSRIDPALLRKGRLLMQYHFQPLEPLKVEALLESLEREPYAERAMTLAEIFNTEDTGHGTVHTPMGFAVGAER